MHEMMKKMKGKEKKMPGHEKDAKMSVLSHLRDMAQESMSGKLGGLKKVSVMSDKPEGLEQGLDKAKELVKHMGNEEESPEGEASESLEEEASEDEMSPDEESLSPEEIDSQIAHLVELKHKLQGRG
jgi:hypothetical protein